MLLGTFLYHLSQANTFPSISICFRPNFLQLCLPYTSMLGRGWVLGISGWV